MTEELKTLQAMAQSLRHIEVLLARPQRPETANGGSADDPEVATERDLRGKYGDPEVRMDPRDWTGPRMKGRPMSACPAEFLDMYAECKDYFARKADEEDRRTAKGEKSSKYERLDAARARGWAKLIRDGKHTVPDEAAPADDFASSVPPDDDIPF